MTKLEKLNERNLKDTILDIIHENEYLTLENRKLEEELRTRPVNIFVDKHDNLLFIENGHHLRLKNNVYNNIRNYFYERNLIQNYSQDGIPVVQILLSKRKIYKLMGKGKFNND